jgi:hypothetical protein
MLGHRWATKKTFVRLTSKFLNVRAGAGPGPSLRGPGFWAKPTGQTPSPPPMPGQARKSPSRQCKAQAQPEPALFRPALALLNVDLAMSTFVSPLPLQLCSFLATYVQGSGLPDGLFSDQKSQFG